MAFTKANWSKFVQETVLILIIKWKCSFSLMHTNKKNCTIFLALYYQHFGFSVLHHTNLAKHLAKRKYFLNCFSSLWSFFNAKFYFLKVTFRQKKVLQGFIWLVGWNFFVCSQSKSISNFYTYFCSVLSWNCTSLNKSESIFSGMCYWDKSKFEKPYQDSLVTNEQYVNGQANILRKEYSFF